MPRQPDGPQPTRASSASVYGEAVPRPLIDPASLAAKLAAPHPPTVLDVRWKLGAPSAYPDYLAGHVPGAAFIDLEQELCGPAGEGGRHPLPDVEQVQAALRAAGVSGDREVVVYDHGDGMAAARAWWTLCWAGHRAVRVLDGGYAAWLAAEGQVSAEPSAITPGDFKVEPGGMEVLDAEQAALVAREGVLLDARTPERYRGETEPIDPVAGRIPGALNMPYARLVNADGTMRDDLISILPAAVQVGAYCGSGITAAHTVLALYQAGRDDVALYVGSWSNWITDPQRPIATGQEQ